MGLGGCSESELQHYVQGSAPKISVFWSLKWRDIKQYLRVYVSELRKLSSLRIGKELCNRLHVGSNLPRRLCPGVKLGIRVEARVEVIDPGDVIF